MCVENIAMARMNRTGEVVNPVNSVFGRNYFLGPHHVKNLLNSDIEAMIIPRFKVDLFDTAFHQTMPPHAFRYAIPEAWYNCHGIRRYGFHGSSHRYVAGRAAD